MNDAKARILASTSVAALSTYDPATAVVFGYVMGALTMKHRPEFASELMRTGLMITEETDNVDFEKFEADVVDTVDALIALNNAAATPIN